MKKVNTDKIKEYLLANPEFLNSEYAKTALLFDTNYEVIRGIARRLREKINPQHSKETTNFEENKEGAVVTCEDSKRVKSLDDLLKACNVDLNVWEVDKYDIGTYEVTGFDKAKRPITIPMFRTKAWLKRIDPTMNIQIHPTRGGQQRRKRRRRRARRRRQQDVPEMVRSKINSFKKWKKEEKKNDDDRTNG